MTQQSEVGVSLIVVEDGAVIAHYLGEDGTSLLASFNSCFPLYQPCPMPKEHHSRYLKWLDGLLKDRSIDNEVSLAFDGTPFQQRVWRYLITMPRGTTRSYSEVAQAIGSPAAVRAVASACAQNQIALAIPCHRVIRADRSLGGYRWGIERKGLILDRESRPYA